jgi:hypothetical protein
MKSAVATYKCIGCGKPAPDRVAQCDCPTGLLMMGDEIVHKKPTLSDLKQALYGVLSIYIDDFSPAEISQALREMASEEIKRII